MKIGFFDSGLGGLIVLRAVTRRLPQYDYEFYGDTAHLPYGDKTEEEIFALTKAGVEHLFRHDCVLVIIACNTASAETLRRLQDSILIDQWANRRILGVIIPTVEEVVATHSKKVCLLATKRTIDSNKYECEFEKFAQRPEVVGVAESRLVPLIETNQESEAKRILTNHVFQAKQNNCDAMILGCTHFSLYKDVARTVDENGIVIFSQDEIIPPKIEHYLTQHPEIANCLSLTGKRNITLTRHRPDYDLLLGKFLDGAYLEF